MLSETIYTLRRKRGLSQEQLAEEIGVSRQAVSKWEQGLSTPELEKLQALCAFFHVSMDELTGAAEAPRAPAAARSTAQRVGILLCLTGAVCLVLLGIFLIVRPSAAAQLNEASAITWNGTGILMTLFLLLMAAGAALVLKKK